MYFYTFNKIETFCSPQHYYDIYLRKQQIKYSYDNLFYFFSFSLL